MSPAAIKKPFSQQKLINHSIGITGLVVLGGNVSSIPDPKINFRNAFEGTSDATVYGATNALVKVMFSYMGYENAFNVVNEVKVRIHLSISFSGLQLTRNRTPSKPSDGALPSR